MGHVRQDMENDVDMWVWNKEMVMEKQLIYGNELKETRHGMENNMIEQACAYAYPIMHICRYAHVGTK